MVALRWHASGSEVRLGLPVGLQKQKTQKFAVHAGGSAQNGGEKRNVLIVSVLLPITIDLALGSNMQRRLDVLWVCQAPVLLRVATAPKAFLRDAEVEDQAPAASLVSQVVAKLDVAAQLARACQDSVLGADRVSTEVGHPREGTRQNVCCEPQ